MLKGKWVALGTAAAVAAIAVIVHAQTSDYVTSSGCMCHKLMHKQIVEGHEKTSHSKALLESSDPKAVVANFSKNPPFKNELKYILGIGRNKQAYVGANMQLLPKMWSVSDKKWIPAEKADASRECIGCHVTGYNEATKTWAEKGVSCEACHGTGKAHAEMGMKDKIGHLAELKGDKAAAVCGQCHARGKDPAVKHPRPVNWKPGDTIEQHMKLAAVVPGAANQQYNELKASKHFAAGVVCTTCHEPHGAGTSQSHQLKKPVNELCLGCHAKIKQDKKHPQVPEGMTCKDCHMPEGMHTFKAPM
jgi:predicted CXXCH cytochrome family protein